MGIASSPEVFDRVLGVTNQGFVMLSREAATRRVSGRNQATCFGWHGRTCLTVSLGRVGHFSAHTVKGFPNATNRIWEPFGCATRTTSSLGAKRSIWVTNGAGVCYRAWPRFLQQAQDRLFASLRPRPERSQRDDTKDRASPQNVVAHDLRRLVHQHFTRFSRMIQCRVLSMVALKSERRRG